MWIKNFFKSMTSTSSRRRAMCRPLASKPRVESLEARSLLSFGLPVDYGAGLSPHAIVSGDFNGDGHIDLATANRDDGSVSVLLGNGDGSFQSTQTQNFGIGWYSHPTLLVADLNGDDNDDLVAIIRREDNQSFPLDLGLLLANGDGTFQPPQFVMPWQGAYPLSVAAGDFNGDGQVDLVVARSNVGWITGSVSYYADVLLGNGDGAYNRTFLSLPDDVSPYHLHAGDFNNDGHLDLVYGAGVFLGNGDGTFGGRVGGTLLLGGVPQPVGDFNGDGNLDLLGDLSQGGPVLQLGNGDGTFGQFGYLDPDYFLHSTAAGDVNADGYLDVVVLTNQTVYDEYGFPVASTPAARVLLGHGDGTFAQPIVVEFGETFAGEKGFTFPVLADFNGDRFLDLAATEAEYFYSGAVIYRGVHVMLNDADGTPPLPPPPYITIGDVAVTEGNTGTTAASFTVTLSKSWDQPVTVAYATENGSATFGSDFLEASGTLTIPAGKTSGTITVQVNGDRLPELNENFFVNLSSATNATIADSQATGTIVDDEPRVSISDVSKAEGKKGKTTLFTFTVTLSTAYDQPVTVSYRTANGTATTGNNDYIAKAGTITFAPGETTRTITIEVKGDSKREANEIFYVDLFGLSSNGLFTKVRGVGTILNDD